jgi:hypothetical protein
VTTNRAGCAQGEFWSRYGDGECIRLSPPLCPFQAMGSKVLAPAPGRLRARLTSPKLRTFHNDVLALIGGRPGGGSSYLVAAGAPRTQPPCSPMPPPILQPQQPFDDDEVNGN